jgi:protoporphyrinogen oxidase
MVKEIDIRLNKKAVCIDLKNKYVEFEDGEKAYYDKLISSIPLPEIIKIIKDVPQKVNEAAESLVATSMRLISVGFSRPDVAKYLWWYIYDEDMYPARVYSPNLKSVNNVPNGCSALQFEVYESKNKKINISDDLLCEHIEKCIKKMNLANKNDVLFMNIHNERYANVVFYDDIYTNREIIKDYLLNNNVKSIGRFGEWDYFWSDQSFFSGFTAVKG